jgi:hypothetical protein
MILSLAEAKSAVLTLTDRADIDTGPSGAFE